MAPALDTELGMRMRPLIERGRGAFRSYVMKLPKGLQPVGEAMHVVTRKDFLDHTALCLDFVETYGITVHVLCAHGPICILIERRHG